MKYGNAAVFFIMVILAAGCMNRTGQDKGWRTLFNGRDLSGWDTYLGPAYDTITKKWGASPVGLNIDPDSVFTVAGLDGEKVLRISGEHFGGMSTTREFENYHLQLKFRWGTAQWPPNDKGRKDSGLMYDGVGPQGADGGFWLRSNEFQIEEGDCGDYWACAGAAADIKAVRQNDSTFIYNRNGSLTTFSVTSPNGRHCIKYPDAEKPTGEWNTIDLYCLGGTSVHVVNGVVTMILNNSRQLDNGKETPLVKGKIQLESEGAEIFYKDIRIESIKKIPGNLLN